MSIRYQVLAPIVFILIASLAIAYWTGQGAQQKSVEIQDIVARSLAAQEEASAARLEFGKLLSQVDGVLEMTTFVPHARVTDVFERGDKAVSEALESLAGTGLTANVSRQVDDLRSAYETWRASAHVALGLETSTRIPTKEKLAREEKAVEAGFEKVYTLVGETAKSLTTAANAELAANIQNGLVLLGGGSVIFLLLAVIVALGITRPLIRITSAMSSLARGEHDVSLPRSRWTREIRDMLAAVDIFRQNAIEREMLASESEKAQIERRRRAGAMDRLFGQLNAMIEATVAGDFSRRVSDDFEDDELRRLSAMTNSLVDTVDHNIAETSRIMLALADGDLSGRLDPAARGAFGRLNNAVNSTMEKLTSLVGAIQSASDTIQDVTGRLSSDSAQLSSRSQRQAASVEETAASLVEMQAAAASVAQKAGEARTMTSQTRAGTEKSLVVVQDAVEAMNRIEEVSAEIGGILEIIDQISFQTNLLALNAGVEAARAGEAGKGFAVVAQEVRDLAQRSANSAHDIKQLIDRTRGEIAKGVELVKSTGGSLEQLRGKVVLIDENIGSIATAIDEQSSGIDGVNGAVMQIDRLTQQNTSMVIETTNAVETMADEVARLTDLLGQFKVDGADAQPDGKRVAA